MAREDLRTRVTRFALALGLGVSAFASSGCDPTVRNALTTGLEATTQSLSSTLITAFFLSLDDEEGTTSAGLTTT